MSPNAGAQPIEAHRMPAAVTDHPVIVSITSLPSRLARICPCLELLLGGSRVPDKILLALSPFSAREHAPYVLPDFLKDDEVSAGKSSRSSQPIAIGDREPNCSACSM